MTKHPFSKKSKQDPRIAALDALDAEIGGHAIRRHKKKKAPAEAEGSPAEESAETPAEEDEEKKKDRF